MSYELLKVDLSIEADKAIDDFKRKLSTGLADTKIGGGFSKELTKEFDKLEQKATATQKGLQQMAATRLDAGAISPLTKEIVRASEKSNQLNMDIVSIRKELANPNRKSSISFLTDELAAAEREASQLERKLATVKNTSITPAGLFSPDARTRGFQKQQLSYQINDIATMAAMGANPTQILASQGGQIAQIFDPKQVAAVAAAYSGIAVALGAGLVAITATHLITKGIRDESERLLKVEENIAIARNKQIIAGQDSIKEYKERLSLAKQERDFQDQLDRFTVDQLNSKRATNEQLLNLNPYSENAKRYTQENVEIDAQLAELTKKRQKTVEEEFAQRFENYKKTSDAEADLDAKRAKEREAQIKQTSEKAIALRESIKDIMLTASGDPLVKMMVDFETATDRANQKFGLLKGNVAELAAGLEKGVLSRQMFELKLNSQLEAFDLREQAANFRNPKAARDPEAERKADQEMIGRSVSDSIRASGYYKGIGGTYGSSLAARAGGADNLTEQQKRDIYEVRTLSNFANAGITKGFGSNQKDIVSFLAMQRNKSYEVDDPKVAINERLSKQLEIISGSNPKTEDEISLANKRIIALTQGMDPNSLSSVLRNAAAAARETEAIRVSQSDTRAAQQAKIISDTMTEINTQLKAKGLKVSFSETPVVDIEVRDSSLSATQRSLGSRANSNDTRSLTQ